MSNEWDYFFHILGIFKKVPRLNKYLPRLKKKKNEWVVNFLSKYVVSLKMYPDWHSIYQDWKKIHEWGINFLSKYVVSLKMYPDWCSIYQDWKKDMNEALIIFQNMRWVGKTPRLKSLSSIAPRIFRLNPVSAESYCILVQTGRPVFARPCEGVHRSISLMRSSLLLQQSPACLVRLTWIVFMMGGKWPYSCSFEGSCLSD